MTSQVEQNKDIVRRYREAHNTNRLDLLDDIVAADLIAHNLLPNVPPGLEGGKMVHRGVIASCPDLQTTTEDLFAEGDKVVERWSMSMTHTGEPFLGAPASGRRAQVTGTSIYRIGDGKIVEHWANMDFLGVLQQLGLAPA
jgi:predicted ester cyclase